MRGNGDEGRIAEIAAEIEDKTPEELEELARIHGDVDGSYRITTWLEGTRELSDAEIKKILPGLEDLFYDRRRKEIAEKLGVRTTTLDKIREPRFRGEEKQSGQGSVVVFDTPEPWPESVNGSVLLDDVTATFKKYIVLPDGAAEALALWTAFTYLHDSFWISPLLCLTSPQKRCGKTNTMTVLGQLVPRSLPATNLTPATVFRTVEQFSPTLLVDEADTFLRGYGNQRGVSEELRGVLNSGHTRAQAWVPRCVEPANEVRLFKTWAPKAIALIGTLPPTLADRSIVVKLQRKRPDEMVERLRLDRLPQETEELRRKLVRWAQDAGRFIQDLEPPDLPFLNDRAADNWRPLLQVAIAASYSFEETSWCDRAIEAACLLSIKDDDEELGTQLLADLRVLFENQETDRISSAQIVEALAEMEDRPWSEYGKNRKPLTKRQLAILLKQYDITPKTLRIGGVLHKGYLYSDLEPAFIRYTVTEHDNCLQDIEMECYTSVTDHDNVTDRNVTRNRTVTPENEVISLFDKEKDTSVTDVTDQMGGIAAMEQQIEERGYIVVKSEALRGEHIIIARDPDRIPERWKGSVVYSPDELSRLQHVQPGQLLQVHATKKVFHGQIQG